MSVKTCKIKEGSRYLWAKKYGLGGEDFLPFYHYNEEVEIVDETPTSVVIKIKNKDYLEFRKTDIYDIKTN